MHLFRSTRRCRERFTAEEDRLLIKQKETDALSWEKIAKFFPSTSPGTPQVRYCTKLKVRELAPKKRRRKGRKAQSPVRDFDQDDGEIPFHPTKTN
jgi:hypothetical protein